MYDLEHKVLVEGIVSQFDWANPHSLLWLKVPNAKGGEQDYAFECASISQLQKIGWTRESLHPGDRVKVLGAMRRDVALRGEVFTLQTADGRLLRNRVGY
jgi:hypothetical protein